MQYTYPNSGVVTDTGTVTRTRPIGFLYDCVDNPFVPCCDCFPADGQIMYFIEGDVFTYQLNFAPDSLTAYNFDGTVIGDFNTWIFGNTLAINVDDLPSEVQCFYFSIISREERYCFDFGLKRYVTNDIDYCYGGDCGIGTITIESLYTRIDCQGNLYNQEIPYSNMRRFLAEIEFIGSAEEARLVDNIRVSSKVYNQFQVRILQPLKQNSRLLAEFVEVIMRGKNPIITIDNGQPYDVLNCVDFIDTLTKGYDSLKDWYPIFTVRVEKCDSTLNCNN